MHTNIYTATKDKDVLKTKHLLTRKQKKEIFPITDLIQVTDVQSAQLKFQNKIRTINIKMT